MNRMIMDLGRRLPAPEGEAAPVVKLAAIEGSNLNGGTLTIAKPITLKRLLIGALLATIEDSDENDFNNEKGMGPRH